MAREFDFRDRDNLFLAAGNGFIYMFAARFGGWFAQRIGYMVALRIGFGILAGVLVLGLFADGVIGQVSVMAVWTFGLCFTWPTLEALVSEGETPRTLPRIVGVYNLVWSGAGAVAFFFGGFLLEKVGMSSLFWIPAGLHLLQLGLSFVLAGPSPHEPGRGKGTVELLALNPRPIAKARMFLWMAWVANPFAYVAINTVVAVIPGVARRLDLSPMWAGFFCSIWFFARLGTFIALWAWEKWHYRFRWFGGAYILLILSFAGILLMPNLAGVMVAQIGFGAAVGLIYYSSLFYSMDVGEAKGEHGGIHESAIGAGIFVGPAIGALALTVFPDRAQVDTLAVGLLLALGLVMIFVVRAKSQRA